MTLLAEVVIGAGEVAVSTSTPLYLNISIGVMSARLSPSSALLLKSVT
jgi:hypothetical protein